MLEHNKGLPQSFFVSAKLCADESFTTYNSYAWVRSQGAFVSASMDTDPLLPVMCRSFLSFTAATAATIAINRAATFIHEGDTSV